MQPTSTMADYLLSPRASPRGTPLSSPRAAAVHPAHMLLRNLRVDFGHRTSMDRGHTLYHVVARNAASGRKWEVVKTSRDVRALQHALTMQLKQGHQCRDVCPWLFAHVATKFPRRVSAIHPSVLFRWSAKNTTTESSTRLPHFKRYLTTVVDVFAGPPGHMTCPVLLDIISKLVIDFFYGPVYVVNDVEASWPSTLQSPRKPSSFQDASDDKARDADEMACGVCLQSLEGDPRSMTQDEKTGASNNNSIVVQVSITTLACGHPFHDECIVTHLNADLQCPVCSFVPTL
ncbi:hypothetical protein DYB28_015698 [Aphanomyces astaci]|uniref:RING-type domain-containing protein n=1 Tax=Aphanomyces astaci TaxID=112090 RepID=A0A9X8DNR2_APHAT|nr:hypothetical protein DYB28_015698 [Aphanomyces astaci]